MNGLLVALVMVMSLPSGQEVGMEQGPTNEQIIEAARQVMISAHYCTLITLDEAGHPQARIMDAFEPEPDLTIWFHQPEVNFRQGGGATGSARRYARIVGLPFLALPIPPGAATG